MHCGIVQTGRSVIRIGSFCLCPLASCRPTLDPFQDVSVGLQPGSGCIEVFRPSQTLVYRSVHLEGHSIGDQERAEIRCSERGRAGRVKIRTPHLVHVLDVRRKMWGLKIRSSGAPQPGHGSSAGSRSPIG